MSEATAVKPNAGKPSQTSQTKPSELSTQGGGQAPSSSSSASATGSTTTRKPRAERVKIDPNESNASKFRRLGRQRVNRALNTIKLVGNLSAYPHDPADAEKILTALSNAVKETETKFRAKSKNRGAGFDL